MNNLEKIRILREGSNVRRCHTLPHHGEYTVGKHSGDALTLLFVLYPGSPSLNLIKAVLWHDVTERFLGDLPSPAKNNCPEFNQLYEALEKKWEKYLELDFDLTEDEKRWLRGIDALELFIWCLEQTQLGNLLVGHYIDVLACTLSGVILPKEITTMALAYANAMSGYDSPIRTNEVDIWKKLMTTKAI